MTTKAALLALLAIWGVGGCIPAIAEETSEVPTTQSESTSSPVSRSFANRVWTRSDDTQLPGVIRIFLSDGTLVSDSCWETHRISPWKMTADRVVSWNEDGMDISAEIVSVTATDLILRLDLIGGVVEERYTAAPVPWVCPDMPT